MSLTMWWWWCTVHLKCSPVFQYSTPDITMKIPVVVNRDHLKCYFQLLCTCTYRHLNIRFVFLIISYNNCIQIFIALSKVLNNCQHFLNIKDTVHYQLNIFFSFFHITIIFYMCDLPLLFHYLIIECLTFTR